MRRLHHTCHSALSGTAAFPRLPASFSLALGMMPLLPISVFLVFIAVKYTEHKIYHFSALRSMALSTFALLLQWDFFLFIY